MYTYMYFKHAAYLIKNLTLNSSHGWLVWVVCYTHFYNKMLENSRLRWQPDRHKANGCLLYATIYPSASVYIGYMPDIIAERRFIIVDAEALVLLVEWHGLEIYIAYLLLPSSIILPKKMLISIKLSIELTNTVNAHDLVLYQYICKSADLTVWCTKFRQIK